MRGLFGGQRQTRSVELDAVQPDKIGFAQHADFAEDVGFISREEVNGAGLGFGKSGLGVGGSSACAADCAALSLVSVVRTAHWTDDGSEDLWPVEVARGATVAQVKNKIAELYGVPEEDQRLQLTPDEGDSALPDSLRLPEFLGQRSVHLLPAVLTSSRELQEEEERSFRAYEAAAAEQAAAQSAAMESLSSIRHRIRFVRPPGAGGKVREKAVWLTLGALTPMQQVYQKVQDEMDSDHPLFLTFNGQLLPPEIPLHFAGISDGDTVVAEWEPPGSRDHDDGSDSDDSLDAGMQEWAAS